MADEFTIKPPPRRIRQEGQAQGSSTDGGESSKNKDGKSAPPRTRRTGVWGDTVFKTSVKEPTSPTTKLSPDTDEDIPVIPDLDELQEEELATQVAQAPSVSVNRVATYKELDSDLFQHAAFASIDDVSLRLLTTCLQTEAEIKEPDTPWTWDGLFTEVMAQLPEKFTSKDSPTHKESQNIPV